jgi:hypothetical protein
MDAARERIRSWMTEHAQFTESEFLVLCLFPDPSAASTFGFGAGSAVSTGPVEVARRVAESARVDLRLGRRFVRVFPPPAPDAAGAGAGAGGGVFVDEELGRAVGEALLAGVAARLTHYDAAFSRTAAAAAAAAATEPLGGGAGAVEPAGAGAVPQGYFLLESLTEMHVRMGAREAALRQLRRCEGSREAKELDKQRDSISSVTR